MTRTVALFFLLFMMIYTNKDVFSNNDETITILDKPNCNFSDNVKSQRTLNDYYLKHGDRMKLEGDPEIDEWLQQVEYCGYTRNAYHGKTLRFDWDISAGD